MYYLGLDVGGTFIKAGLIDENIRVLQSRSTPTVIDDLNGIISKLTDLIKEFQKSAGIEAVGIGVPGLRSSRTHAVQTSPNIPCLKNVNLEELVADEVHLKVVTENDANAAAYGEFICGAGIGLRNLAYLTLGTGVGSALVLNGSLYTGTSGYAAEFGHTVVDPEGRVCGCGRRGCIETLVSATGIVVTAKEKLRTAGMTVLSEGPPPLTAEKIYDAAVRGDELARQVFTETGRWLGIGCANLINFLNPEMIIVGGGVMASGDLLLSPARDFVGQDAFPPSLEDCRIVQSKLWPDGGLIGAALLAREAQAR